MTAAAERPVQLEAAQWIDLKRALKSGTTPLELALEHPSAQHQPVVSLVCLAMLAPGSQDRDHAARAATDLCAAATIAERTTAAELLPAGKAALVMRVRARHRAPIRV